MLKIECNIFAISFHVRRKKKFAGLALSYEQHAHNHNNQPKHWSNV